MPRLRNGEDTNLLKAETDKRNTPDERKYDKGKFTCEVCHATIRFGYSRPIHSTYR